MRFYLDHDVDSRCCRVLQTLRHDCWTANHAKLATAFDETHALYAQWKRAVLITHDAGFAKTNRTRTMFKCIWLRCEEPDARDVLAAHLPMIMPALEHLEYLTVELRVESYKVWPPRFE